MKKAQNRCKETQNWKLKAKQNNRHKTTKKIKPTAKEMQQLKMCKISPKMHGVTTKRSKAIKNAKKNICKGIKKYSERRKTTEKITKEMLNNF